MGFPCILFQARLGSQSDAQAMQAVRTARGNSFCVDCDAPSKKQWGETGRWGCSPREGRGTPSQPPPLLPQRDIHRGAVLSSPAVGPFFRHGLLSHLPRWSVTPYSPAWGPCLSVLLGHWARKGSAGQVAANMCLLDHRRQAGECMLLFNSSPTDVAALRSGLGKSEPGLPHVH